MISFKEENRKFNFRVGAIIMSHDKTKVLLHTIKGFGFYLLPGGRVEWMENCESALRRELEEEIGLCDIVLKERLFMENFFVFKDVEFQEIAMDFVVELNKSHSKFEEKDEFFGVEGEKYMFKWVDIKDVDKLVIKPAYLKEVIKNYNHPFEYKIIDER